MISCGMALTLHKCLIVLLSRIIIESWHDFSSDKSRECFQLKCICLSVASANKFFFRNVSGKLKGKFLSISYLFLCLLHKGRSRLPCFFLTCRNATPQCNSMKIISIQIQISTTNMISPTETHSNKSASFLLKFTLISTLI